MFGQRFEERHDVLTIEKLRGREVLPFWLGNLNKIKSW